MSFLSSPATWSARSRELVYDLHMAARGYLRHHAAVDGVQVGLGEHLVRDQLSPVPDKRDGGLVAGGFNGKDPHDRAPF